MSDGQSKLIKFLNKLGPADADFVKVVEKVEEIVGAVITCIPIAGAIYQAGKAIAKMFGLLKDGPSELQLAVDKILKEVEKMLQTQIKVTLELTKIEFEQSVGANLAVARTAFNLLRNPPDDVTGLAVEVARDSESALRTLENDAHWKLVADGQAVFEDPLLKLVPGTAGTVVFEYRLTLLPYLEVLGLWLAVSQMVGRELKKDASDRAEVLRGRYQAMRDSIVDIRFPTRDEFAGHYQEWVVAGSGGGHTVFHWQPPSWSKQLGAVDRCSGSAVLGECTFAALPPAPAAPVFPRILDYGVEMWEPAPGSPEDIARQNARQQYAADLAHYRNAYAAWKLVVEARYLMVCRRIAVARLAAHKELYRRMGLPAIWRVIHQLHHIAGKPPLGVSDPGSWSLADVARAVHAVDESSPPHGVVSARALAGLLAGPTSFSMRSLFLPDPS